MVCALRFLSIRRNLTEVAQAVGTSGLDGTDPRAVESYLRRMGLTVLAGEMTINDLAHFGRTGRPVLCLVQDDGVGHYVVSAGTRRGRVYFQDPLAGPRSLSRLGFDLAWWDYDRLGPAYRRYGLAVGRLP